MKTSLDSWGEGNECLEKLDGNVEDLQSLLRSAIFCLFQSTFFSFHLSQLFPFPILFTSQVAFQNFAAFGNNRQHSFRNLKLNLMRFHLEYHSSGSNVFSKSKNHLDI